MDYVLFGMGYGASLMLLGWALRTFGPQFKYKNPPQAENPEYQVEQRFWVRFIQGLGGVLAIAGTAFVLMTFVVVLVNPSDAMGRNLALGIWVVILISILAWCWFYIAQYGLTGIWSRSNGYGLRSTSSIPTPTPRTVTTRKLSPEKPVTDEAPVTAEVADEPESANVAAEPVAEPVDDVDVADSAEPEVAQEAEPEEELESGPVYDFGDGTETTVPSESGGRAEALRRLRERQERLRKTMQQ